MRWAPPGCAPMCCRSRSGASSRPRIKEYTADRVVLLTSRDRPELERLLAKVGGLHERMWAQALAGTEGNAPLMAWCCRRSTTSSTSTPPTWPWPPGACRVPILVVLLATSALSLVLVGFGNGHAGRRFPLLDGVYAIVLAVALWMTIDLDRPRQGIIQVSSQPMVDALASMKWRRRKRRSGAPEAVAALTQQATTGIVAVGQEYSQKS